MTQYTANTDYAAALRVEAGRYIKRLRKENGITQQNLADDLGYDRLNFVSNVENGRSRVPPHDQKNWAAALGVDCQSFMTELLRLYDPYVWSGIFGKVMPKARK